MADHGIANQFFHGRDKRGPRRGRRHAD
jgi:hypothetical protein